MAAIRVLIVDDSNDDAELTELALREAGIQVECRRLYREDALREALAGFDPHLVVCDVNLPGYSGREAHALVLAHAPGARFVFMTGALAGDETLPVADGVLLKDDLARLPALVRQLLPN
ncbi:response regulator [Luteimonas sp. MC1572]|uniref:response regulator n=1 Tax=Luteimonas sp. MC1572 TaxID=2799325 RepID=UPI0018F0688C|nr:response regulator [Luteimonas sp. MC1572]MBJ6982199.1 response regulator [Luteimonas sp. MC1572]